MAALGPQPEIQTETYRAPGNQLMGAPGCAAKPIPPGYMATTIAALRSATRLVCKAKESKQELARRNPAGDAYAGGFLAGFCQNLPIVRCAELGNIAAGEVISRLGARPTPQLKVLAGHLKKLGSNP